MKIAITCPASLPATQFGGIMFLCVNIARKISDQGHEVILILQITLVHLTKNYQE